MVLRRFLVFYPIQKDLKWAKVKADMDIELVEKRNYIVLPAVASNMFSNQWKNIIKCIMIICLCGYSIHIGKDSEG